MSTILLNKMYSGNFLQTNTGHEIINLFKSDNGKNYIYVQPHGTVSRKDVNTVLLTRGMKKGVFEILAKAEGLYLNKALIKYPGDKNQRNRHDDQCKEIIDDRICYDGVPLNDLFNDNNMDDKATYITFCAAKVIKPKTPIYIVFREQANFVTAANAEICCLGNLHPGRGMRYIDSENSAEAAAYETLADVINNPELWGDETACVKDLETELKQEKMNFLKLIGKENDELAFSNLFAYYFRESSAVFNKFTKDVLQLDEPVCSEYSVKREYKNIDLLIEDKNNVIVIENKIKSGINGITHTHDEADTVNESNVGNGTVPTEPNGIDRQLVAQLAKYYKEGQNVAREGGKPPSYLSCFIFTPDYNHPELKRYVDGDNYTVITYRQLWDFFKDQRPSFPNDRYYEDFINALEKHASAYDNDQYEEMKRRMANAIHAYHDKKKQEGV